MKQIDVFYQGEGVGGFAHVELEPDTSFSLLKTHLAEKHRIGSGALLFLEDADEPVDETLLLKDRAQAMGLKAHIHRCRMVEVLVTYNGEVIGGRFSPATTVGRIKRWAAERELGMSEEEAGEHALQISGSYDRPVRGTHIGALTDSKVCSLAFDLVTDERVNGRS